MEKIIIYKNLKFWGIHSIINAIPSFLIAYTHDWNTLESIVGMIFGIITFIGLLTFITSLANTQKLFEQHIIEAIIKAGSIARAVICIVPLPLFIITFLAGGFIYNDFSLISNISTFYIADFFSGLFSHSLYRSCVEMLPFHITDIRGFGSTFIITILQGSILTALLVVIGIFLSPLALLKTKTSLDTPSTS